MKRQSVSPFDVKIIKEALWLSVAKFHPNHLIHNPVIFIVGLLAFFLTLLLVHDACFKAINPVNLQIVFWLWLTVYFANFAEAIAEGRGKAQASFLKRQKTEISAKKLEKPDGSSVKVVPATELKPGDIVLVEAGDLIPSDGEVIEGVASVDESAITGESAPVIRESGGDRSAVTGGTLVLSDWLKFKITAAPGSTFLDHMIALVEGAQRKKTPNEIALTILLVGLSLILLMAVVAIPFYAHYSHGQVNFIFLGALLVALIPTTIGSLLSAIGIAGMDRLLQFNVLAMSGRAVEAAGDVDTLLLDKTGTITLGNRVAVAAMPVSGVLEEELMDAAQWASLSDETPEGRSIVVLAKRYGLRGRALQTHDAHFVPFSAHTRMSGIDIDGIPIRKGAVEAVIDFAKARNQDVDEKSMQEIRERAAHIAHQGGTPLAVTKGGKLLGVIHLKDIVKGGIRERFSELRKMGIRTVMVTGDNPLTAAAIAAEAGVDDFIAEATPEMKLNYIREEQKNGHLVAMCGDGTNDAPALAQADVGVAMNTGTTAAKEAGNMIDLDSDPTKLIEIVILGKQLLMTRGSLTTFSIANDVAKYFALLPAMFFAFYPGLKALDVMNLKSPQSAVLSAIIFNTLVIPALVPLAIRGVAYRIESADRILTRNLLYYGLGGLILPFLGIKGIDLLIAIMGLA